MTKPKKTYISEKDLDVIIQRASTQVDQKIQFMVEKIEENSKEMQGILNQISNNLKESSELNQTMLQEINGREAEMEGLVSRIMKLEELIMNKPAETLPAPVTECKCKLKLILIISVLLLIISLSPFIYFLIKAA